MQLRAAGKAKLITDASGLELDAYFSATKLKWLLDNVPGARARRAGRWPSAPSTAG
jgi:glycerol kinase